MKKTILSILTAFVFCCSLIAQDGRQRTVETLVQDVMAALPAQNMTDCYEQMADLAKAAPASVTYLASKLQPAEAQANNIVEYAIAGVVRYATDPANSAVKENVKKGVEQAIAACKDKYNKQFLEAQLRIMQPYQDGFPAQMQATYFDENAKALLKSKENKDQCRALWLLAETLGEKSEKTILSAIRSDEKDVRNTALLAYEDLAGDEFYAKVAKLYKKLSPEAKADIVYWFGEKGVKSQLPLVLSELGSEGMLGANAVEAAGKLGDKAVAEKLLAMLGGERANEALAALRYIKADYSDLVAAALAGAKGKAAADLLTLAASKGNNKAADAVLALAGSSDSDLASKAAVSLAGVVSDSEFESVAKLLDGAKANVPQLANALMATLRNLSKDEKYSKASSFASKAANPERFYSAIASTGTDAAIDFLKEKYTAGSEAALDALATISSMKVAPILLDAAAKKQGYLKNYVNIIDANESDVNRKCDYYCQALDKATDNDARNYIIEALGWVPTMRALAVVSPYIDNQATVRKAADAAKRIAAKNAAEVDYYLLKETLGKVTEYYKGTGVVDDGYAIDEIKKILESVKPYEKYQLTAEEKKLGYEILFDGTDLSKWIGDKVGYQAVNGCIEVTASYGAAKNLYTEKEYTDFVLRFDFCFLKSGVNNGIGIRTPQGVDAAYDGMCEVQILDHDAPIYADLRPYQVHGSVYGIVPAKRIVHKPLGEWSTMEIRVVGDNVKVTVNGEVINDANVRKACKGKNVAPDGSGNNPYTVDGRNHPGMFNKKGHVGFLGHGAGLKYRNVRILDLSARK